MSISLAILIVAFGFMSGVALTLAAAFEDRGDRKQALVFLIHTPLWLIGAAVLIWLSGLVR